MLAEQTLGLPFTQRYFYLCSSCTLASMHPRATTRGTQNVRCTSVYANMLLGAQKNEYQDLQFLKPCHTMIQKRLL